MRLFQRQETRLLTKSLQRFFLLCRDGLLALLGQQTAIQTLAGRGQLTLSHLPQRFVVKHFQGSQLFTQRGRHRVSRRGQRFHQAVNEKFFQKLACRRCPSLTALEHLIGQLQGDGLGHVFISLSRAARASLDCSL